MLNNDDFAARANERYQKAREFWRNWRAGARDDYGFIAGQQWATEDENILKAEDRPSITFNYSEKMIDAVAGAEVSNRQEVHYIPRGMEDAPLADLWNSAAQWAREESNAEDEESDAFRDVLICGLGWTWTRLSYDEDLDGKLVIERVDPLEMFADPAASKPGLADRRYHDRLWWVDETDVKRQWPDALFSIDGESNTASGVITHGHRYNDDTHQDENDRHKGQVQLRLHESFEMEDVYRVAIDSGLQEVDAETFAAIKDQLQPGQFAKQRKRVYYRAFFAGETLLELKKSPCQEGFCFQAMTGKRDRNRNTWYGLTRVMKDPQRWANKWLSQILHIINTNAKGGLMAEIGAFVDPTRAQEEWSSPDSITMLNEGGIGKVEQKQAAQYPAGLDKLMSFALNSLPMVTGINLEALGLANREQAGVLEQQRKQAAYGLLAPIFDALRRYRKAQGRVLLYYIHTYISDGRLVRIGGPESQQFLPLTKQPDAPRYDIIVDTSPNAPDAKQKTWESLVEILPAMMKANMPIPPDLLDYTPLPTTLVTKWKAFIGNQQQVNEEAQQQITQLQQENESLKQDQQVKMQELQFEQQQAGVEMQLAREKAQAEIQLAREKAQAEYELEAFKMDREFELEERRAKHEAGLRQQQVDNEFKVKSMAAGLDEAGKEPGDRKVSIGIDTSGLTSIMQSMLDSHAQQSDHMAQALTSLRDALAAPRKLITDAAGRPVGSTPVLNS